MHRLDDLRIEHRCNIGRIFCHTADDLRNVVRLKLRIAGIDALGGEREQKILVEFESFLLEHRKQNFISRSRIRGGLEYHELTATHVLLDLFAGRDDVRHVGVLRLAERGRDADDDHVAICKLAEVSRRGKFSGFDTLRNVLAGNIDDVRSAGINFARFLLINFEADSAKALEGEFYDQRKPYVAESDHPDGGARVRDQFFKFVSYHVL